MNTSSRRAVSAAIVAVLLVVLAIVGYGILARLPLAEKSAVEQSVSDVAPAAGDASMASSESRGLVAGSSGAEQMSIASASVELWVDDVVSAVEDLKSIAARHGGKVSDVSIGAGGVMPLDTSASSTDEPTGGWATLRIPADRLELAMADASAVGEVRSTTESSYDVTLQHVDLTARLDNLTATEARMRELLAEAQTVADTIQIEAELSRLRGEIDSLRSQLDYLDDQIDYATLSVQLTLTPSPSQGVVGFDLGEVLMRGVRAAFELAAAVLVGTIAVLPLVAVALVVWFIYRAIRKARS